MSSEKFLWWGSEILDFESMCYERNWVSREQVEEFILELLPSNPKKVRVEVPTDYWSDIENPRLKTVGKVDLLEIEGMSHYPDKKIEFRLVARMERGDSPSIDWKIWKMQKKNV